MQSAVGVLPCSAESISYTTTSARLPEIVERKWKDVDANVREDVKELKAQIDYMTKHHISREELNQYLSNLNSTVDRLTDTLNKFL